MSGEVERAGKNTYSTVSNTTGAGACPTSPLRKPCGHGVGWPCVHEWTARSPDSFLVKAIRRALAVKAVVA